MPATAQELEASISLLERWLARLRLKYQALRATKTRQELLYQQARLLLGRDASPLDIVNDDLGCAESVSNILKKVIYFPIITGTWTLNDRLMQSSLFIRSNENAGRGTIIISPTGTGNGSIRGHVGILGDNKKIMAANSRNGLWSVHFNVRTWTMRYSKQGGFPIFYHTLV